MIDIKNMEIKNNLIILYRNSIKACNEYMMELTKIEEYSQELYNQLDNIGVCDTLCCSIAFVSVFV